MKLRWSFLFLLVCPAGLFVTAQGQALQGISGYSDNGAIEGLEVPPYRDRLMDLANVLQPAETEILKGKMIFLPLATSTQLAILIIPDLKGQVQEKLVQSRTNE